MYSQTQAFLIYPVVRMGGISNERGGRSSPHPAIRCMGVFVIHRSLEAGGKYEDCHHQENEINHSFRFFSFPAILGSVEDLCFCCLCGGLHWLVTIFWLVTVLLLVTTIWITILSCGLPPFCCWRFSPFGLRSPLSCLFPPSLSWRLLLLLFLFFSSFLRLVESAEV